jgi:hypothetical protein
MPTEPLINRRMNGSEWLALLLLSVASVGLGQHPTAGSHLPSFRRVGTSGQFDDRDHIGLDVVRDFRIGF